MNCKNRIGSVYLPKSSTMFLSNLLRKVREKGQRKNLLRDLIRKLHIDETQRLLYLESLELLDEEGLEAFYYRLTAFVDGFETKHASVSFADQKSRISGVRGKEEEERRKEAGKLHFLFDTV